MSKDTWGKISERISDLSDLDKVMQETEDLLNMKDFQLMDFDGKTVLDRVINVTGNRAASYGLRVIENITSYKWQTVVEGDISQREAHTIEEFLNASLDQTNVYLSENFEDVPDLYTFWAKHICNRGRIGAQWMSWIEDGEYKIHCVPLDMRWTPYVKGKWIAPRYWMKKDKLEQEIEEYEKAGKEGRGKYKKVSLESSNTGLEVRDYWGKKDKGVVNEFWVSNQLVYTQEYNWERLPFVTVVAPSGFMFRGKDFEKHEGEDIYFLIKKLEKEMNRSLSIEQTIGMDILYPPYEQLRENIDGRPADLVPRTGETGVVRRGEEHKLLPRGDLNRASQVARVDIMNMMENGAPMQPHANSSDTAVKIATEAELLSQFYNSRLTALEMSLAQLFSLMIDMCVQAGKDHKGEIKVGIRGKRKHFSLVQLKDPEKYSVSCKLMGSNAKLEIVNEARALALWGRMPRKYILEDILHVEDPAGWERALELEKAKEANPAIGLLEMAVRFAEEAEDTESEVEAELKRQQSKILTHDYVKTMKQRIQPAPVVASGGKEPRAMPEKETGNTNALIPLLGQRGMTGGGRLPKLPEEVQ